MRVTEPQAPGACRETAVSCCFPALLRSLMACLIVCVLVVAAAVVVGPTSVFADQDTAWEGYTAPEVTEEDFIEDEPTEGLSLTLSAPEAFQQDGVVYYRTRLSVQGISALYGYQIQVESIGEEQVVVESLVSGVKSQPVYKEGDLYLAVISSDRAEGDVEVCEITSCYPLDDTGEPRRLVVRAFTAVTNIGMETMISTGPEPPAAVLELPLLDPAQIPPAAAPDMVTAATPFAWYVLIILLLFMLVVALFVAWRLYKSRKKQSAVAVGIHSREG